MKPKSGKSSNNNWNSWDPWEEEGVWLEFGRPSDLVMSMDQIVTTPPPNLGHIEMPGSNSWSGVSMVKPKSGKSESSGSWNSGTSSSSGGLFDNNWVNPNVNVNGGWVENIVSSKGSKSYEMPPNGIGSSVVQEVVMVAKSAKTSIMMSYPNHAETISTGIKLTSKTGKSSYYTSIGQEAVIMPSYPNQADAASSGVKLVSKTGKASFYSSNGQVVIVSKSAKHVMSVDDQNISHAANGLNSVSSKTGKALYYPTDGHVQEAAISGIKVAAKTGKASSAINMSVDYYASKSAKSLGVDYSEESGELWIATKSAKGSSSKSSKSSFYEDTIVITPEEAGLPFRAKSSKSIPLRHIHDIQ
jgi:hypothetical protein